MSEIPSDLKFLESHEWVRVDDDVAEVGISDHAQAQLGDLVYVELPEVGDEVAKGDACAVVESVKAASDVYAPIGGEIVAVNEALDDAPERVNEDAYGKGWLFRLRMGDSAELGELLDADAYGETLDDD